MTETLTIDHVGQHGDGVAMLEGSTVFVPYALRGEIVEAEPAVRGQRFSLGSIVTPSPQRIEPFCPHFGTCGGCAIQHWQPEPYRAWKRQLLIDALNFAGIDCDVAELIDAHGEGRRRAVFHANRDGKGTMRVGFAASGSHTIVPIDACPILAPGLDGALDAARKIAALLDSIGKPLDIQATASDSGLDIDIRGSGPLGLTQQSALANLATQLKLARVTRHGELVTMRTPPEIQLGRANVRLPAGSFMQATGAGEDVLARLASVELVRTKNIADLFCGFGPFALRLAEKAKISAYDNDEKSIASLRDAVKNMQGLKPISAETRDLFKRPLYPEELKDFDAVVFDPPRQGAKAQTEQLAASRVPSVIAVSCNATSFARDARILIDGGYKIGLVTPVDQFRHTPHVEIVAAFRR